MSEQPVELLGDSSYEIINSEPAFSLPFVNDNVDGWGPNNVPEKYKDLPYQKFSKSDRIGKVKNKEALFLDQQCIIDEISFN